MGDIFREIDEELRQERFEKLWQRYGKVVIGAAVGIIVSVLLHYMICSVHIKSVQFC